MHKLSKARLLGSVNGTMAELCDAVGGIGVDRDRNHWVEGLAVNVWVVNAAMGETIVSGSSGHAC